MDKYESDNTVRAGMVGINKEVRDCIGKSRTHVNILFIILKHLTYIANG